MQKCISGIIFVFNKNTVLVTYNKQTICFHNYNQSRKANLQDFADEILSRRIIRIDEVFYMARNHKINSQFRSSTLCR
jgi:hypothetical protein